MGLSIGAGVKKQGGELSGFGGLYGGNLSCEEEDLSSSWVGEAGWGKGRGLGALPEA